MEKKTGAADEAAPGADAHAVEEASPRPANAKTGYTQGPLEPKGTSAANTIRGALGRVMVMMIVMRQRRRLRTSSASCRGGVITKSARRSCAICHTYRGTSTVRISSGGMRMINNNT